MVIKILTGSLPFHWFHSITIRTAWVYSGSQIFLVKYHCVRSPRVTFLRSPAGICAAISAALSSVP